jgi:hypothetical protein
MPTTSASRCLRGSVVATRASASARSLGTGVRSTCCTTIGDQPGQCRPTSFKPAQVRPGGRRSLWRKAVHQVPSPAEAVRTRRFGPMQQAWRCRAVQGRPIPVNSRTAQFWEQMEYAHDTYQTRISHSPPGSPGRSVSVDLGCTGASRATRRTTRRDSNYGRPSRSLPSCDSLHRGRSANEGCGLTRVPTRK